MVTDNFWSFHLFRRNYPVTPVARVPSLQFRNAITRSKRTNWFHSFVTDWLTVSHSSNSVKLHYVFFLMYVYIINGQRAAMTALITKLIDWSYHRRLKKKKSRSCSLDLWSKWKFSLRSTIHNFLSFAISISLVWLKTAHTYKLHTDNLHGALILPSGRVL